MILKAINIKKSFTQDKSSLSVLKGIDFSITEGEVISIVGPSGAGKSTLLHIAGGLDKPSEGTIELEGEDIYQLNDQKRASFRSQKMGFIFQFYHLLPEFTALENVMIPNMVHSNTSATKEIEKRSEELLDQVGLCDRLKHRPSQLSGGEQQRVAIARAMINNPKIIFCDEPTGNLDSETGEGILNILFKLNEESKQTLVIVTHDQSIAERSHRTLHMRDGLIIK